ncbi:MAG: 2-succinyl-5-enolpyruvyl-6-hydroxy-3-cyclohexene-1-carboxylic-acid synthase [Sciscionella sp.]
MQPSDLAVSNHNYIFTCRFVDALAQMGLRHACVSPGYNNSPIVLAFADHPTIQSHVFHDERTAGFAALGLAKSLGEPVVVAVTAGTAAAHLHPAVIEAWHARVPVLVLTADRPAELRDVGERQAVNQAELYGPAAKWFHDATVPSRGLDLIPYVSGLASHAWSEAIDSPAGPVHVNMSFREPKAPIGQPGDVDPSSWSLAVPRYLPGSVVASAEALMSVATLLSGAKAMIVAGELPDRQAAEEVLALGAKGGFPVFADPLSFLRAGRHSKKGVFSINATSVGEVRPERVMSTALGLNGDDEPDVVVRFGSPVVSKALTTWLASRRCSHQVVVDDALWQDPTTSAAVFVRGAPGPTAHGLADRLESSAPAAWTSRWREHVQRHRVEVESIVEAEVGFPSEPAVVISLAQAVPAGSQILAAASMPIRDVDNFFPFIDRPVVLASNRGASGIDGLVATSIGMSLSGKATATYLLLGDVALLHDLGSLRAAVLHRAPLTIVAVNNDGGGIFHFVPQVDQPHFEPYFGTPHGTAFGPVAEALGIPSVVVEDRATFAKMIASPTPEPRLLEVRTQRNENAKLHESIWAAIGAL